MPSRGAIAASVGAALAGVWIARGSFQAPAAIRVEPQALREYTGVYQWRPEAFVYVQLWSELTATEQLVAFDESGEIRALHATGRDRFFAGPGAAVATCR